MDLSTNPVVYIPDLSRVRQVATAIKAIPSDIRREEVAHILALLVQRINANTLAWQDGDDVMQRIGEVHDQLEYME
jgi:hypothetical protein